MAPDIQRGDSGGWVVEYLTLNVYGHLVASDVLGDGYVIPLLDTLEDIRERTHAQEVGLATGVDIACKLGDALIPEISTEGGPSSAQDHFTHLATANWVEEPMPWFTRTCHTVVQTPPPPTSYYDSGYVSAFVTPEASARPSGRLDSSPSSPRASTPSLFSAPNILDETPGSSLQPSPIFSPGLRTTSRYPSETQTSEGGRKGLTKAPIEPRRGIRFHRRRLFDRFH